MIEEGFIQVQEDLISISFLDEQIEERRAKSKTNSDNGKRGGRPKKTEKKPNAFNSLSETKANESQLEEKRREKKREEENILEKRETEFRLTANTFSNSFSQLMILKFCDYWTEPNKSKTKMKFELQKTFDIKRRLTTWSNNDFGKNNPAQNNTGSFSNNTKFEETL